MPLENYKTGTICWAKLKGFPWWPSVIMDESILTKEVRRYKPKGGKNYPVMFFGSIDFAWLSSENLEPYEENLDKHSTKPQNRKEPKFGLALKQAIDPDEVERLIQSIARESEQEKTREENPENFSDDQDSEGESRSNDDSDDSNSSDRRSVSKKKKTNYSTPAKRRESSAANRDANGSSKKSRTEQSSSSKSSKASDLNSPSSRKQSNLSQTRQSNEDLNNNSDSQDSKKNTLSIDKDSSRKTNEIRQKLGKSYDTLMVLRHKIQRLLLKGEITEDLDPIDDLFRKVEKAPMTVELLQVTKMGKLMRKISQLDKLPKLENEKFSIKLRAEEMTSRWRRLVSDSRAPSEEIAASNSNADLATADTHVISRSTSETPKAVDADKFEKDLKSETPSLTDLNTDEQIDDSSLKQNEVETIETAETQSDTPKIDSEDNQISNNLVLETEKLADITDKKEDPNTPVDENQVTDAPTFMPEVTTAPLDKIESLENIADITENPSESTEITN
ncbi:hypothetical protein BB561_000093 [Smittium simulii]|uniref:PWWP domain-containing protein n=1 Tax=Smittium simulii TaxID=133385 RepID=A0A2T9Z0K6_9FUNG|nr:hypothetical protein BB561_000093 [Smittium simulii]